MVTMVILPGALCPKYTENEQFICRAVDGIRHETHKKSCKTWTAVGDYELILWGIEAMLYILHLSVSKPL